PRSPELVYGVSAAGDRERDRAYRLRRVDVERGVADDDYLARLDVATVHRGDASDRDPRDLVPIARVGPEGAYREVPVQMAALELDPGASLQPAAHDAEHDTAVHQPAQRLHHAGEDPVALRSLDLLLEPVAVPGEQPRELVIRRRSPEDGLERTDRDVRVGHPGRPGPREVSGNA